MRREINVAPLIGITGRRLVTERIAGFDNRFHETFADVYFADYGRCILEAGGIPVTVSADAAPAALTRLDGIVLTGGQDIRPEKWHGPAGTAGRMGDPRRDPSMYDDERDAAEFGLVIGAVTEGVPMLGICRGMQVINAALGGSLHADLRDAGLAGHDQSNAAPDEGPPWHEVRFERGSVCEQIYGPSRRTNSWHHQAIDQPGSDVVATGRTADGVVEAIEISGRSIIGVQWHPEWSQALDPIFEWLVEAARTSDSIATVSATNPR